MSDWINTQVMQSVLRWLSDKVGIMIVAHGILSNDEYSQLAGAVISLAVLIFGIVSARFKHQAIDVAGGKETIKQVVLNHKSLLNK